MEDTLDFESKKGQVERITSGVNGFDDLIQGGFPKGSFIVVTGTPGSGKSIFGMQYLWDGLQKGDKCLYISVEQKRNKIVNQASQFGWNYDESENNGQLKIIALKSQELYEMQKINELRKYILENNFDRVVLDSISSFNSSPISSTSIADTMSSGVQPSTFMEMCRSHAYELIDALQDDTVTVVGISQKIEGQPGDTSDNVSEFRADALIVLESKVMGKTAMRTVQVKKMRETNIDITPLKIEFSESGITIV